MIHMHMALIMGSVLTLAVAAPVRASVFLNGVNIDGVTNQTFDNCKVVIDDRGNVFITAKGYQVKAVGSHAAAVPAPAASAGGPPTMHYWLVTEKSAPGMTQYDMDLYINNKLVRRLPSKEGQVVMNITKYLQSGPNKIYIMAKKNLTGGRRSSSPQHYFRLIMGEGTTSEGQNVFIDREVLSYKRTAADSRNFNDLFNVNAR